MRTTRLYFALATFFVALFALSANAHAQGAALDPPHDDTSSLGCLTCHDMMAYSEPNMIPDIGFVPTPGNIDDTQYNNICWGCHYDGGPAPDAVTHSSQTTDTDYGNWTIQCVVCHNQHQQEMDDVFGTTYGMFIRRNINLAKILDNAPPYGSTVAGKNGTRKVKFTGPATFADGGPTIDGICEVCHTQTTYYRNDGTGGAHNSGANCTLCHIHSQGFVGGADHSTFIVDDTDAGSPTTYNCSTCHTNYASAPETSHSACVVCHIAGNFPQLVDSSFPTYDGQIDDDGTSMYANLQAAGYDVSGLPAGRLLDPQGDNLASGAFEPIPCGVCHAAKPAKLDPVVGEHGGHIASDFVWTASCGAVGCHDSGTNTNIVNDIHGGTCTVCHDNAQGGSGTTIIGAAANGIDADATIAAALPDYKTATCVDCHDITDADVNAATLGGVHHDNKTDGVVGGATCTTKCHNVNGEEGDHTTLIATPANSCASCHTNTPGGGAGTGAPVNAGDALIHDACLTCHAIAATPGADGYLLNLATADTQDPDIVTAMPNGGAGTDNGGGNCTDCHTLYFPDHNHVHTFTADAACATCHGNPTPVGSNARDAVATPFIGAGEVHAGSGCATCHDLDATPTGALIGSAIGQTGATGCISCHIGGGDTWTTVHTAAMAVDADYVDHATRVEVAADCATCHGNPTPGTSNARDAQATPFVVADDVHEGGCILCHTGTNDGALQSSPTNADTVTNGDCKACHTVTSTWSTIHEADLGVGSDFVDHTNRVKSAAACETCHGNSVGTQARDAITTPFSGSTEVHGDQPSGEGCRECHTSTGGMRPGSSYTDQILTGGTCIDCHTNTSTWLDRHLNATVDHSAYVANTSDGSCETCHSGTGSNVIIAIDNSATRAGNLVHNACTSCHDANTGATTGSTTYGGGDIAAGNCKDCHSATYFDSHVHGTAVGYISHNVTYNALVDLSQVSMAGDNPCADCHTDNSDAVGAPLDSWTDILGEHLTSCAECHSYTDADSGNTPPLGTHNSRIGARAASTCTSCHTPKLDPASTSDHGGHQPSHFGWGAGGCDQCHSATPGTPTEEVVADIHGNTCDLCHTTGGPYNKTTEKLGDNGDGDARLANGAADAGTPFNPATYTCTTCHNQTQVPGFHGITIAEATSSHQLSSDMSDGYDCESCHSSDAANEQLNEHMGGTDTPAQCATKCHKNTTASAASGIVAQTVVDNAVTASTGENCEACHAAKGDYQRHGMSDDDTSSESISSDGGFGVGFHNNLTSATGEAVGYDGDGGTFTSKLSGYTGLSVTTYSCDDCHSSDRINATNVDAVQAHTKLGGGSGNCLTCHNGIADFEAQITAGLPVAAGGSNASIECEDCHNATINGGGTTNSPSGKRMYQYDGVRHHTTDHAQEGDCTWCHADPRPATPTQAGGYAATADISGTYDTGWETDYAMTTALFPKQVGCRLCHTNYETYSVNVRATNDNDSDTTEINDLHGYHINNSANDSTAIGGFSNTGLVIYANDFNATTASGYPGGNMDFDVYIPNNRVEQTAMPSHYIPGASKIDVYDYGACLGCHSIQYWHAAPKPTADYPAPAANDNTFPFDTLRYAPGRSIFNVLPSRGFDGTIGSDDCGDSGPDRGSNSPWSWRDHCEPNEAGDRRWNGLRGEWIGKDIFNKSPSYNEMFLSNAGGTANGDNWYMEGTTGAGNGFTRAEQPVDSAVNNYEGLGGFPADGNNLTLFDTDNGLNQSGTGAGNNSGGIVTFADITAPAVDDITIEKAEWDGSTLTVWASSTNGDPSNLTFTTSNGSCTGEPIAMTWVGGNSRHEDTTCTDLTYVTGVTLTVTAATGETRTAAIDYVYTGPVATLAIDDSYPAVPPSATTQLLVLANDQGTNNLVQSTDDTNLNANCSTAVAGGGSRVDITCGAATGAMGTFDYTVQGDLNSDVGTVTITVVANNPPTITVNQPDGVGDTGTAGGSYTIDYDANDTDGTISVDFFYDNDAVGEDGTAIASCQNLTTEGAGLTCNWTSLPAGTWYVYGIATDDLTATTTDYSSGTVVVSATPPFSDYTMDAAGLTADSNPNTYLSGFGWSQGTDSGTGGLVNGACWYGGTQQPPSGGSLGTMGNPIPFFYLEASTNATCGGYTAGDSFWLESGDLDASTYSFTMTFDWLYESTIFPSTGNNARQIQVWYRNGSGGTWTQLGADIQDGPTATENSGSWTSSGVQDFSSVLNAAQSRIRITIKSGTASNWTNDIGIDNIYINGTP